MPHRFDVTFDYLCPFARNAHEHLLAGLSAGATWEVGFRPYSLAQGHVEEGRTAVWEHSDPFSRPGVLALAAGVAVRDHHPEGFLAAHGELFAARHDRGEDIKDAEVVRAALDRAGVDGAEVLRTVEKQDVLAQVRQEHETGVAQHEVWGVPTFIGAERAAFVRLMDRPGGDPDTSITAIEQVIALLDRSPMLHEFKQTDLPR